MAKDNSTPIIPKRLKLTYSVWQGMKYRCNNPNAPAYKNYGGRGIKICMRWSNSFHNFLSDMGERPTSKHTLDRIDNDKGYSPDNCRWATRAEQGRNTRANRLVTYNGQTKPLIEWSEITGVNYGTLRSRLDNGMSLEDAFRPETIKPAPFTFEGQTHTLRQWADIVGISYQTLRVRINRGWSIHRALTEPLTRR